MWEGGDVPEHNLDDVTDGVGRVFGSARTFESTVDEELKDIEDERPYKQDRHDGIGGVVEDMVKVPVGDPLMEGRVLDVPTCTKGLEGKGEG